MTTQAAPAVTAEQLVSVTQPIAFAALDLVGQLFRAAQEHRAVPRAAPQERTEKQDESGEGREPEWSGLFGAVADTITRAVVAGATGRQSRPT